MTFQELIQEACLAKDLQPFRDQLKSELYAPLGSGSMTMLAVIRHMDGFLTNQLDYVRMNSIEILTECVQITLPRMTDGEARSLIEFCVSRLADYECIEGVVKCATMIALQDTINIDASLRVRVVSAILAEVKVQYLRLAARSQVYKLLGYVIEKYPAEVVKCGKTIVINFTRAADGERDPRNVISVFHLYNKLLDLDFTVAELAFHVEDLFENISCYFPISFAQDTSDPLAIKKEDLSQPLHAALSRSMFSSLCIPFLVDKMSSPIEAVKKDCLDVLRQIFVSYSLAELLVHMEDILVTLRNEILKPDSLTADILRTVELLGVAIEKDNADSDLLAPVSPLIHAAMLACEIDIANVNHSKYHASMLHYIGRSAPQLAHSIFMKLQPMLHSLYLESDLAPGPLSLRQKECVMLLAGGILSCVEIQYSKNQGMVHKFNDVIYIVSDALSQPQSALLEATAVECAACLIAIGHHTEYTCVNLEQASTYVVEIVSIHRNTDNEEVSVVALKAMTNIGRVSQDLLGNVLVKEWEFLTSTVPTPRLLFAACSLSKLGGQLFDELISILLKCVKQHKTLPTILPVVQGIQDVISSLSDVKTVPSAQISITTQALYSDGYCHATVLFPLVTMMFTLYAVRLLPVPALPWSLTDNTIGQFHTELLRASYVAVADDMDDDKIRALLDNIESHPSKIGNICLGVLALQHRQGEQLVRCVQSPRFTLQGIAFVVRGLLMRGKEEGFRALQPLLEIAANTESAEVVSALDEVLVPSDWFDVRIPTVVPTENWKENYFSTVLQRLLKAYYDNQDPKLKGQALCIVANITTKVVHLPFIKNEAEKMVPLLIDAMLTFDEKATLEGCCDALHSILPANPQLLLKHKEEIATAMLRGASFGASMKVRSSSLQVLQAFTLLSYDAVEKLKDRIVKGTLSCVSDPKRVVRQAAQACRDCWFLMEAPNKGKRN